MLAELTQILWSLMLCVHSQQLDVGWFRLVLAGSTLVIWLCSMCLSSFSRLVWACFSDDGKGSREQNSVHKAIYHSKKQITWLNSVSTDVVAHSDLSGKRVWGYMVKMMDTRWIKHCNHCCNHSQPEKIFSVILSLKRIIKLFSYWNISSTSPGYILVI